MSNEFAIAAVTRTLLALIKRAVVDTALPAGIPADIAPANATEVTSRPLDKARDANTNTNQLNLYLYHTVPNAAWRNTDLPPQAKPGDIAMPPLALNLYYLITAFGENNAEQIAQFLLGRAMLALHDNALLMAKDISDAFAISVLQDQVERVRITAQPLSTEEMYKLWATFQTQYRISAAYEVAVVLIESKRPKRTTLPVRAPNILVSTFRHPMIDEITPQIAFPGDTLTINGQNLKSDGVKLRFSTPPDHAPDTISDGRLTFVIPPTTTLRAGVNTVQVAQDFPLGVPPTPHPGAGIASNVAAFMVAPLLTSAPPAAVARGAVLAVSVAPPVYREQRAELLLTVDGAADLSGAATLPALPRAFVEPPQPSSTQDFRIPDHFAPGNYLLRVRVDGAESGRFDNVKTSPTFDQFIAAKVTIT